MPRVAALAVLVALAACHRVPPPAAAPAPSAGEPALEDQQLFHHRVEGILAFSSGRAIPAGDTFVTWSPKPVLYTTVIRTDSTIASGAVTNEGVVGTAVATWRGGVQQAARIRWTRGRVTLMELRARYDAGVIHVTDERDTAFRAPSLPWTAAGYGMGERRAPPAGVRQSELQAPALPWAVADYGMEDQLLPLFQAACLRAGSSRLAVYRPYPTRWVTITVVCRRTADATLVTETEADGEHFYWTITADGALVRLMRDRVPGFERRPLELTNRATDYARLRDLREQ